MYFEFCQVLFYGVFAMFFGLTVLFTNLREYMTLFHLQILDCVFPKNIILSCITTVVKVRKRAVKQHAIYSADVIQTSPNIPDGSL